MSVSVEWNNPDQTVMRFIFEPPWDWSAFHEAVLQSHVLLNQVKHSVVRIFDVREYEHLPTEALEEAKHMQEKLHPYFHPTVIVLGAKPLARSIGELFRGVYQNREHFRTIFACSMDDAAEKSQHVLSEAETG